MQNLYLNTIPHLVNKNSFAGWSTRHVLPALKKKKIDEHFCNLPSTRRRSYA